MSKVALQFIDKKLLGRFRCKKLKKTIVLNSINLKWVLVALLTFMLFGNMWSYHVPMALSDQFLIAFQIDVD
jgi:hypothetical protein